MGYSLDTQQIRFSRNQKLTKEIHTSDSYYSNFAQNFRNKNKSKQWAVILTLEHSNFNQNNQQKSCAKFEQWKSLVWISFVSFRFFEKRLCCASKLKPILFFHMRYVHTVLHRIFTDFNSVQNSLALLLEIIPLSPSKRLCNTLYIIPKFFQ